MRASIRWHLPVLITACCFSGQARADSFAAPTPGIYASSHGSYWVKTAINRSTGTATATLCRYDREPFNWDFEATLELREEIIWKQDLGYIPARLLVSDWGWVVGVDQHARHGYEKALVIWDRAGKQLAVHALEDLLCAEEIDSYVMRTVSNRFWRADFEFRHDGYRGTCDLLLIDVKESRCLARDPETKRLTIDLRSGALWPNFDPEAGDYDAQQHAISTCRARYSRPSAGTATTGADTGSLRIYARSNQRADEREVFVESDGRVVVRADDGTLRHFRIGPERVAEYAATLEDSAFTGLRQGCLVAEADDWLRSIIIETAAGVHGTTVTSVDEVVPDPTDDSITRFVACWRFIDELLERADSVEAPETTKP